MAERRKRHAREVQLGFEAISIEGGLLSPEWLSRIAQLNAGAQSEADYRIPKGLNLRDEIGRYWRIAQANWNEFAAGRAANADAEIIATRFIESLLRDALGYSSVTKVAPVVIAERSYPIGMSALTGRVPVVVAAAGSGLDTLATMFGDGGRRRSAFGLAQEYLNAQDGALWGIASDGLMLRIVRDNASLTRPAWIEVDVQRVFSEDRYSDFAALWLLMHETRFGLADQPVTECALEIWRNAGREEGTRAREHLRRGVEDALLTLGQGFLSHPDNQSLRTDLRSGSLSTKDYFNQLLRLVYRIIFLLTVEERGLLHPSDATAATRTLYQSGYSLRRLRDRSLKRSAHDRFSDLWESTKIVLMGVASGESRLGLPALAGIFAANQCPALDMAKLENRALLFAVFKLAWLREDGSLARVNWRDMGPEELGSVYESLLELVPQITNEGRQFAFASGGEAKGNARKTTGSYYTPDSLVQVLLDSALEPVIAETISKNPEKPIESLLSLSIVDPACGSGHFLLAAARRLASHIARVQANGTPSAADYRHALRQVVGRCIYGVDMNPMAVELCRVSLWMEAVEPGLPLTFLNSHIQLGNALLGTTPELMAQGIPDTAWEPIEGDDKKIATLLKKRNRAEAGGQRTLDFTADSTADESRAIGAAVAELDASPDVDLGSLVEKEIKWDEILESTAYRHQKFVADAWCAAFVWPKHAGEYADAAPTNELWRRLRDSKGQHSTITTKTVSELGDQYRFFHWHLQFPQVFGRGGFDAVLGNPPWDTVRFNETEFFAERRPEIARASTATARKRLIAKLETDDPVLFAKFNSGLREVDGVNVFIRAGVRYPLCGVGRVNLFALFAETARSLVSKRGRVGQILPSSIVSDDSTKLFFQSIVESRQIASFFDFENREGIFEAVHRSYKFGILTLAGSRAPGAETEFVFFATNLAHLKDPERKFTLSPNDIALLNPETKTCPIFRSRRDADLTKVIYRRVQVLRSSGWRITHQRLINQSDDSDKFSSEQNEGYLPLYEGKYFHHYDHRWVTNDGDNDRSLTDAERNNPTTSIRPRFWYPSDDIRERFGLAWRRSWVLAWRDITNATNERTLIAAVVPSLAVPNSARVVFIDDEHLSLLPALIANLGAFVLDFIARQKVGGMHMSGFIVDQLAILGPKAYEASIDWPNASLRNWFRDRVIELTYTANDMTPFARDLGYDGMPFRWDTGRRFLLRCELDAAFFHLYGISRDDTSYIMDTFPIVQKNDEKTYGEYRTKRVVLEIYDAIADAASTGKVYQTRLDPPPADVRVAHPSRVVSSVLPVVPSTIPSLLPAEETALIVWAMLRANGGVITRIDLARAFSLRSTPALLGKLAPEEVSDSVQKWLETVGARTVASGTLAGVLRALIDRNGAEQGIDNKGRVVIKVCSSTAPEDQIDPWFQFEARLALYVLKSMPNTSFQSIDESIFGEDRALLQEAS